MEMKMSYACMVKCPASGCFIHKEDCFYRCLYGKKPLRAACVQCEIGRQVVAKWFKALRENQDDYLSQPAYGQYTPSSKSAESASRKRKYQKANSAHQPTQPGRNAPSGNEEFESFEVSTAGAALNLDCDSRQRILQNGIQFGFEDMENFSI
jgi:hypothetical protein